MRNSLCFLIIINFLLSCNSKDSKTFVWQPKLVTATAYNSISNQTNSQPNITAFGDTLVPRMKCIAVSRDLLKSGLKYNTLVAIEGLDGVFLVKDKMHSRWQNRIDIYMGNDVKAAKEWGRKKLNINYRLEITETK